MIEDIDDMNFEAVVAEPHAFPLALAFVSTIALKAWEMWLEKKDSSRLESVEKEIIALKNAIAWKKN